MDFDRVNSRIHVCARLRPLIAEDYKLGNVVRSAPERCVHLSKDGQTIKLTKDAFDAKLYRVDHTFDEATSQVDVYDLSYKKIVVDAINGYNGTGMVYGQTGSGKSHTIFGNEKEAGLVQLAINDVFQEVRLRISKDLVANVFLSFYQLYLEQAYDLLVNHGTTKAHECIPLGVREDAVKGTFVENLQYVYVDDEATTMEVLRQGLRNRKVHSTTYNMSSSRSHAIFQMYLDFEERGEHAELSKDSKGTAGKLGAAGQQDRGEPPAGTKKFDVRRRVLTFVDLAGSERVQAHHQAKSRTQFKESVAINKSISALGNCIQALASMSQQQLDSEGNASEGINNNNNNNNGFLTAASSSGHNRISHVPFRDCKLTRLLAEPLGGNSKTCIIVNIGPCAYNLEETSSTLKFARRAMTIRKRVKKGAIEQLQVQDVFSEEAPPPHDPSPPRISLGGKKVTSLKLARIVVRDSPEERQHVRHRYADSDVEDAHSVAAADENGYAAPGQQEGLNGSFGQTNSGYFLDVPAGSAFDSYGTLQEAGGGGSGSGSSSAHAPSVRLNLGDFLRACQAGAGGAGGYQAMQLMQPVQGASVSSNHSVVNEEAVGEEVDAVRHAGHTPGGKGSRLQRTPSGSQLLRMPSYVEDNFMEDIPRMGAALTLDTTFSPILASSQSYASSPYMNVNSSANPASVSLSWPASLLSPATSSAGKAPRADNGTDGEANQSPGEEGNEEAGEETTHLHLPGQLAAPQTPAAMPNILLPSPYLNLDNGPRLSYEDGLASAGASLNVSTISAASPLVVTVATSSRSHATVAGVLVSASAAGAASERKQRRFVWERGSGDVNHTVDLTPVVSRQRPRGSESAVVAVASVPTQSPHHQQDRDDHMTVNDAIALSASQESKSGGASAFQSSPSRLSGKKVSEFMKYAPAAPSSSSSGDNRSNASSPDPTLSFSGKLPWKVGHTSSPARGAHNPVKPPLSGKKPTPLPVVTSGAVRDETNSMPRSGAPKPSATQSPPPLHVPTRHPSAGSTGPYNFLLKKKSANGKAQAQVTPRKKSVNWGDKKVEPSSSSETKASEDKAASPMLAATLHPFERKGYSSPRTPSTALTPDEVAAKLLAADEQENNSSNSGDGGDGDGAGGSKGQGKDAATPQSALVKLVQELRDELHRKDAEISTLKNFILHN